MAEQKPRPIPRQALKALRRTVKAYAAIGLDFELAVWMIGSCMKKLDVPITQRNLETVFSGSNR